MRGEENRESVKSVSGREDRWAERSHLTCKTYFGIAAAYCARSDLLSPHAEGFGGSVPKEITLMCMQGGHRDTGTDKEVNIMEVGDLWTESRPLLASYF